MILVPVYFCLIDGEEDGEDGEALEIAQWARAPGVHAGGLVRFLSLML